MPKGVVTDLNTVSVMCIFRDVTRLYNVSTEILTRCDFIAPGIADFLFPKAVPNEKHIPTCVPQCYDVEKILILFILDTSKCLLWQTVTTQMSQPPKQQAFSDRL